MFKSALILALLVIVVQATNNPLGAAPQQYMELTITNNCQEPLRIRGFLRQGHWYDQINRNKPIDAPNVLLQPGESNTINVSGKILAPELASATGQLEIVREIQGQQVGHKREMDVARVQFDSSFAGDNRFRVRLFDDNMFSTNQPDWEEKGVLGRLSLKIYQHKNW